MRPGASLRPVGGHLPLPGGFWGASRGPPWGHLGRPGSLWGPRARNVGSCSLSGAPLGALLGPSRRPLVAVLGPLGPSCGRLGGLLGRLVAVLRASWAVLERLKLKEARTLKSLHNHRTNNIFAAPRGPLGKALGSLLGLLAGVSGHLGRLGPLVRRFWALLGRSWRPLGALLGQTWACLGPPQSHATTLQGAPGGTPGAPGGARAAPENVRILRSGPFKIFRSRGLMATKGPEDTPARASRHGGGS